MAEVVVLFDNVPPPLIVHMTPAAFLSCATVAVSVIELPPSTVAAVEIMETLIGAGPPQPEKLITASNVTMLMQEHTRIPRPERAQVFQNTDASN